MWEGLYTPASAKQVIGFLENRLDGNPAAQTRLRSFAINCFGL